MAPVFRIFHVDSAGTLTLDQIGVVNGRIFRNAGGCIFNRGTLIISNSLVADGVSDRGSAGGIANVGTLTVLNSRIARNRAGGPDSPTGGGISNSGRVIIMNSTLEANQGVIAGGGIINRGTAEISNSTIANNSAGAGGGIENSGTMTVTNTTIANNRGSDAGAISSFRPLTILNSTIASNIASRVGGISAFGTPPELQNTILALNSSGTFGTDCSGPVRSLGNNLVGDTTGCTIDLLPTDLTGDPGLGDFTDDGTPGRGHFPLTAESQAIDAGNAEACPETDQLGLSRTGVCDIGAVEFQGRLQVVINIRPRGEANRINPNSDKEIRVAILSSPEFAATTVDPNTVRFGATGSEAAPVGFALRDVDGDGDTDMVVRFEIQDTAIRCGATSASLTGQTSGGLSFSGSDLLEQCAAGHSWSSVTRSFYFPRSI
jgi:hypothetical protein